MDKILNALQSRKFWVLAISLTGIWTAVYAGTITVPDAINASVAALGMYSVGVAINPA
jgi:hypothetical protein